MGSGMAEKESGAVSLPYLTFNAHLRSIFGCRVQKIPLDAGLTCPNRDGTVGTGGCIYCNQTGSGTGAFSRGKDVGAQMRSGMTWAAKRYRARRFIAYFQSFSNTYASLSRLRSLYSQALVSPDVVGLFIGTRPDCVNRQILSMVRDVAQGRMIWMEYGLQSASDRTLRRINRGHAVSDFVRAVEITRSMDIPVCAHVIFGLPGEGAGEMRQTVRLLADLGVQGVKFHQLYVVRGTRLERWYREGRYSPISLEEYADMVAWAIRELPAGTVIHRLTGDPMRGELVAPGWSSDKIRIISMINSRLTSL